MLYTGCMDDPVQPPLKVCNKCGESKPLDAFSKTTRTACGVRGRCKACYNAEGAAYRDADRVAFNARQRQWRADHPERAREIRRRWSSTHTEAVNTIAGRYKERHSETIKTYQHGYQQANPGLYNALWHKRRAKQLGNGGSHTEAEWEALKVQFGGRCLFCGRTNRPLTKDHVLPITQGGTDGIDNLQPLCQPCNSAKGARHLDLRAMPPL